MQLLEKKPSPPSLSVFTVSLILALVIAIFFVYPRYRTWQANKADVQDLQSELGTLSDQTNRVNNSLGEIQQNQSSLSLVNAAIPSTPSTADLYAHIEQLVKASNLTLATIQATEPTPPPSNVPADAAQSLMPTDPNAVSPSPTLSVINLNMEVKGGVTDFDNFLAALEKSLRFIDVQSIDVTNNGSQVAGAGSNLSIRLVIKTYYQK